MVVPAGQGAAASGLTVYTTVFLLVLVSVAVVAGGCRLARRRKHKHLDDYRWRQRVKVWQRRPHGLDFALWTTEEPADEVEYDMRKLRDS